jgi:hypothetical protein
VIFLLVPTAPLHLWGILSLQMMTLFKLVTMRGRRLLVLLYLVAADLESERMGLLHPMILLSQRITVNSCSAVLLMFRPSLLYSLVS